MKKRIICSILSFLALTNLYAENRPDAFTISISEAYYHFSPKRHLDGKGMPNIALAYNFNCNWAVEAAAGLINAGNIEAPGGSSVHGYLYSLDGLYRFCAFLRYAPYVAAGVGYMNLSGFSYKTNEANMNLGLGTEFFIWQPVAIRLEARDVYTPSGGKNDYMINLGLSFIFDRPKCKPCPVTPVVKCNPDSGCKGELYYRGYQVG